MKNSIYTILLAAILCFGCEKGENDLDNGDYLVFGTFYGMCQGETCVETYKIDNKQLYEDQADNYNQDSFNFEKINNNDYAAVEELVTEFPEDLYDEPSTIGCPDCADQGGVFILYKKNGVQHKWRIDNNKEELPQYLQEYTDLIKEKIELINN